MRRRRLRGARPMLLGAGLLAATMALSGLGWWATAPAASDPAEDMLGRGWVNRLPEDPRSTYHLLFLDRDSAFGVTYHGTQLRYLINVLEHEYDGEGGLKLTSLQDNIAVQVTARTSSCDGPGILDLCLDLTGKGRGGLKRTVRLYSSTQWDEGLPAGVAAPRPVARPPLPGGLIYEGGLDALDLDLGE